MADAIVAESESDGDQPSRRRANIRLAVIFGIVAVTFYVSMFVFMS